MSNIKKHYLCMAMKKLLAIALLFFYLSAISGVAISSHFCCGEIASVKIQLATGDCGHHSQQEDKNCCNDLSYFFKIHDPQQATVSNISCKAPVLPIPVFTNMVALALFSHEDRISVNNRFFHSPPPRTTQPLFVRNESFLI